MERTERTMIEFYKIANILSAVTVNDFIIS